jgi:hypothetical protein
VRRSSVHRCKYIPILSRPNQSVLELSKSDCTISGAMSRRASEYVKG